MNVKLSHFKKNNLILEEFLDTYGVVIVQGN